jgi:hypothetical protein
VATLRVRRRRTGPHGRHTQDGSADECVATPRVHPRRFCPHDRHTHDRRWSAGSETTDGPAVPADAIVGGTNSTDNAVTANADNNAIDRFTRRGFKAACFAEIGSPKFPHTAPETRRQAPRDRLRRDVTDTSHPARSRQLIDPLARFFAC